VALSGSVPATAKVQDIARTVIQAAGPVAVVDGAGRPIGQVSREAVLGALIGEEAR
jgi:hypothetical protein